MYYQEANTLMNTCIQTDNQHLRLSVNIFCLKQKTYVDRF